jgi:hypothetical protein
MLRALREDGIATLRDGKAAIHDWERLERIAEFDAAYLHLDRRSR